MTAAGWVAFLAAAAIGAPARYVVDRIVTARTTSAAPWGTFVVNVSGCFVLGVLTGLGRSHDLGSTAHTVLGTGGLGAYTTFSTFSFEVVRLAEAGDVPLAGRYALGSLAAGTTAAAAGLALAAL
jgi:CrcB protein